MWPLRHFLITCGDKAQPNIIAVSFCMPLSKKDPFVACAIGKKMYSYELIEKTKEFIINVPPASLKPKVYYCGYHSGREVDKFRETGLTPKPGHKVSAPFIEECVAHMECKVKQEIDVGEKTLFIAEIIDAYADEDIAENKRELKYSLGKFPRKNA